jgi:methyltransferase (TIGR00027 family)
MQEGQASRTARLVAAYRALAGAGDDAICTDPWASALAGEEGLAIAEAMSRVQPQMQLWIAVRTAFIDQAVKALIPAAPQVVILGAGLDTRAARLAHPGVRYFEVDAPASSAEKRARLAALGGYPTDAATHVTCDFEREDFLDRLDASGFDRATPAVVVWEGVTYYLTEPAVRSTLERLAAGCHPESVLLFDHVGKKVVARASKDPQDDRTMDLLDGLGEPFLFGTNDPVPLVYAAGFRKVRVTSFDEACLNLTGTYDRERRFRFQWLVATSVARAL